MTQLDPEMVRELINAAAKNAALEVATEIRKDLSKAFERVGALERHVGMNGNGLTSRVDNLEQTHRRDVASLQVRIGKECSEVNRWKWMVVGGSSTLTAVAAVLAILYRLHGALK